MNDQITTKDIDKQIKTLENSTPVKQKLKVIKQICSIGEVGEKNLLNYLIYRRITDQKKISLIDGLIFEKLYTSQYKDILNQLNQYFGSGIIQLSNDLNFNYQPLQELLINQNFQEADKLTQKYLCQLAGLDGIKTRNWLYFTDIPIIPSEDLFNIDLLWQIYSRGKFGFSIQRQLWIQNNCKWHILWKIIGWTKQDTPCRYPEEFIWTIDAPIGHLPLFNQLRGMQVLSALFNHIVWQQTHEL